MRKSLFVEQLQCESINSSISKSSWDMSPQHTDCPGLAQDCQVYHHHHDIVHGLLPGYCCGAYSSPSFLWYTYPTPFWLLH